MRSHHKRPRQLGRPPDGPPPLLPGNLPWMFYTQATIQLTYTFAQRLYCQACGARILSGETVYKLTLAPSKSIRVCYRCGVAILIYRGDLDPSKDPMPPTHTGQAFGPPVSVP